MLLYECSHISLMNHDSHNNVLARSHAFVIPSVYSIVNEEPNAEEMKAKVKAYEEANKSQIVIRQSQRADEERSIADRYVNHWLYGRLDTVSSPFV